MAGTGLNDLLVGAVNNYRVDNSLQFSAARSTYLARKTSNAGNRKTFTFSTWMKRGSNYGTAFSLYDHGKWDVGASQSNIRIQGGTYDAPQGYIEIYEWNGAFQWRVVAALNALLDTSAWYHILVSVNTTRAADVNRVTIWVNGIRQNEFWSATYPALNADTNFCSDLTPQRQIGATYNTSTEYFDGLLADTYWIDGRELIPSAFGEFTDDGTFIPRKFVGDVGPTGFYLDYSTTANVENMAVYSENFQPSMSPTTGWAVVNGVSRVANSGPAPNGSNTATKIVTGTISGVQYIWRTQAATYYANNTQYTISWYAKAAETTTMQVVQGAALSGGVNNLTGNYDLVNVVATRITGDANAAFGILPVGGGWNRCWATFTTHDITSAGQLQIRILDSSNTASFLGNGVDGFHLWGYQINPGATPDPYVFTNAAAQPSTYGFGVDKSSLGLNSFVPVNLQISSNTFMSDVTVDVPTDSSDGSGTYNRGNYCQLNVNDFNVNSSMTWAATRIDSATDTNTGLGTIAVPPTGKWYWEVTMANTPSGVGRCNIGVVWDRGSGVNITELHNSNPRLLYINDGRRLHLNGISGSNATGLAVSGNDDIIGVAFNADTSNVAFYKNNTLITSSGTQALLSTGRFKPCVDVYSGAIAYINFGRTPFRYTPPADHKALNSYNLPTPAIIRPKKYFDVKTWSGNNATTRVIDGYDFSPDLVIIKNRTSNNWWGVYDTVRGGTRALYTNQPAGGGSSAEILNSASGWIDSFNTDGYTLNYGTTGIDVNSSGNSYISFAWEENPNSLDVINWSGDSVNGRTIAHNLGSTPGLIIVKNRLAGTTAWRAFFQDMTAPNNLEFDDTDQFDAVSASSGGGIGTSNSSVFTLVQGTTNMAAVNATGSSYIAYVFPIVQGFSKMGVYSGNGTANNGPFIYTGFKPALVMIKGGATGIATNWVAFNSKSDKNTVEGKYELYPNLDYSEALAGTDIWTFANGFKVTGWNQVNGTAGSSAFLYAAWADVPFKYARAR